MNNWLQDFSEVITRQGEERRAREELRNNRLDKIITELDSCNIVWYLQYSGGTEIAEANLSYKGALHFPFEDSKGDNDPVEDKTHSNFVQQRKRHIVETCIIPAMHACVRAGFLKPSDVE